MMPYIWLIIGAKYRKKWQAKIATAVNKTKKHNCRKLKEPESAQDIASFQNLCENTSKAYSSGELFDRSCGPFVKNSPEDKYYTYLDTISDTKEKTRFKERVKDQNENRVVLPKGSIFRVNFTSLAALTGNFGCNIIVPQTMGDDEDDLSRAQLLDILELGKHKEVNVGIRNATTLRNLSKNIIQAFMEDKNSTLYTSVNGNVIMEFSIAH